MGLVLVKPYALSRNSRSFRRGGWCRGGDGTECITWRWYQPSPLQATVSREIVQRPFDRAFSPRLFLGPFVMQTTEPRPPKSQTPVTLSGPATGHHVAPTLIPKTPDPEPQIPNTKSQLLPPVGDRPPREPPLCRILQGEEIEADSLPRGGAGWATHAQHRRGANGKCTIRAQHQARAAGALLPLISRDRPPLLIWPVQVS